MEWENYAEAYTSPRKNLFSSLVPSVEANLSKCKAQGLSNIAWAHTVANVDSPSVFNEEFINSCIEKENGFIDEESQGMVLFCA